MGKGPRGDEGGLELPFNCQSGIICPFVQQCLRSTCYVLGFVLGTWDAKAI